ncbi:MAG: tetratricopeptide repeat protein [Desulfovibrionaceae bacterium]|nr:tetratricopeptide repeat protein [Desulfovibrionaceae bacterium]MDD4951811.1 tetratricopeptide repeat protein [Desulfovibrionaceae bacterium]
MAERKFEDIEDYIADLKAKSAQNPGCGNTHYNLGVAYLSKRDFMAAERELLEAVDCSPKMSEAYVQLGGIAMHRGDLDGCLNYNLLASQQRPFFAVPWGNIGFVQLQKGEVEQAVKSLKKAVKYDPNFVQALATLGSAYFNQGELDLAVETLEKCLKIQPRFGPAWNNLALCHLERGDFASAGECVQKARESGYEVPEAVVKELEDNL